MGSVPRLGRSPGGGHDNGFQYPCLENPIDRGAWWATFHWVATSCTQPKKLSLHTCITLCLSECLLLKRKQITSTSKDVEKKETLWHCWQECKLVQHFGKEYGASTKSKNRTTIGYRNSTPGYLLEENKNTNQKRYMLKSLTVWITINCGKFLKRQKYQITLPAS